MILAAAEMYCPEAVAEIEEVISFSHITLGRYPWSSLEVSQSIRVPSLKLTREFVDDWLTKH